MKYEIQRTSQFKKDYKLAVKRGFKISLLKNIIALLADGKQLPEKNKDHALTGNWKGYRECHIELDWILIYRIYEDKLLLSLTGTGTHSDYDF